MIAKGVIFSIFDDLRTDKDQSSLTSKEDSSVWVSTTLIQALRQLVDIFGQCFDIMGFMLNDLLDLLKACMTQENETLSRIGATCLQQLVEANLRNFDSEMWDKVSDFFVDLSESTTPHALFFDLADGASEPNQSTVTGRRLLPRPQKKEFQLLISKCVQHLLVLQTLTDVVNAGADFAVYRALQTSHLIKIANCFKSSYLFAKEFNENLELRNALFKMGFMKQMPNLLKQETSSVSSYIHLALRMYCDERDDKLSFKSEMDKELIP
jgi:brefeldin A-inhibited guanine nucleotide-exchange protein